MMLLARTKASKEIQRHLNKVWILSKACHFHFPYGSQIYARYSHLGGVPC